MDAYHPIKRNASGRDFENIVQSRGITIINHPATFLDLHRPTRSSGSVYLNGQIYEEPHHYSELINENVLYKHFESRGMGRQTGHGRVRSAICNIMTSSLAWKTYRYHYRMLLDSRHALVEPLEPLEMVLYKYPRAALDFCPRRKIFYSSAHI